MLGERGHERSVRNKNKPFFACLHNIAAMKILPLFLIVVFVCFLTQVQYVFLKLQKFQSVTFYMHGEEHFLKGTASFTIPIMWRLISPAAQRRSGSRTSHCLTNLQAFSVASLKDCGSCKLLIAAFKSQGCHLPCQGFITLLLHRCQFGAVTSSTATQRWNNNYPSMCS